MMLRIGMLTPSSNTVLEPMSYEMLAGDLDSTTIHFSRFKVTEIGLGAAALGQFTIEPILAAAKQLADAKCSVIAWNGTSASWLGFASDERLVTSIEHATGIKAATCVLGYRSLFLRLGVGRIGLVTPYTNDVQARIIATWGAAGFDCAHEQHCELSENFAFAEVEEARIEAMIRKVAEYRDIDAVAIVCTNMRGARIAARLEQELGIPILDSVAVTLWASLQALGAKPSAGLASWARLFQI